MNTELNPPNPNANPQSIGRVGKIGLVLMLVGFGGNLTVAPVDQSPSLAGLLAAATSGVGASLLLLAVARRLVAMFTAPGVTPTETNDSVERSRSMTGERWRRRTVLAFVFSRVATVSAVAAYGSGVALYFTNFSFGSGGNDFGVAVIVAGMAVGLSAMIGDVVGLVAASLTWKHLGSKRWFIVTLILLLLEIVAIAFLWSRM